MIKTKSQKGITLIALIITIIVLLILAVVATGAVQNDGIINHAKNAREQYGKAQEKENTTIGNYLEKLEENLPGNGGDVNTTPATTITEAQADAMLTKIVNSDVTDKYKNKITVPAGFKILVDNTTGYTPETIDVTKGIVITDGTNEFVWIPVGEKIFKNETEFEIINLDRYTFGEDGTPNPQGDATIKNPNFDESFTELATSTHGNATAKDLQGFKNSATTKGGYYIARYEAGVINHDPSKTETIFGSNYETNGTGYVAIDGKELQLVIKKDVQVWDDVTQNKASELSRNMYKEAKTFTSDLANSYAWDTALVFIEKCSTEAEASNYANSNKSTSHANAGINLDKYCNIHDMSGNSFEWSTETNIGIDNAFIMRGGGYYPTMSFEDHMAGDRFTMGGCAGFSNVYSFRPILYVVP